MLSVQEINMGLSHVPRPWSLLPYKLRKRRDVHNKQVSILVRNTETIGFFNPMCLHIVRPSVNLDWRPETMFNSLFKAIFLPKLLINWLSLVLVSFIKVIKVFHKWSKKYLTYNLILPFIPIISLKGFTAFLVSKVWQMKVLSNMILWETQTDDSPVLFHMTFFQTSVWIGASYNPKYEHVLNKIQMTRWALCLLFNMGAGSNGSLFLVFCGILQMFLPCLFLNILLFVED